MSPKHVCMCVSVLVCVALLCISWYIRGLQDASCAHTHHLSGLQRQADWQAHLSLVELMNWQVCVCVCVTVVCFRKSGFIFSVYIQKVLPMYFSSVCVHVTAWIIACKLTCYLSVDMNSRGVVVLVQRVVLTKPKPEQALGVVTDADRQTEDMMKVSISQSNILN